MSRRDEKITRAAHIKRHTEGTSNEISFSVLDAAKNALEEGRGTKRGRGLFGKVTIVPPSSSGQAAPPTLSGDASAPIKSRKNTKSAKSAKPTKPSKAAKVSSAATFAPTSAIPSTPVMPSAQVKTNTSAPASASVPARSPEVEIARRKARRKLSKVVAISAVAMISLALLVFGGWYLYQDYQHQQANVTQLDEALSLLSEADDTVLLLDEIVEQPFADDAATKIASVSSQLDSANDALSRADELARAASTELKKTEDKEVANQAVAAIAARKTLLSTGEAMMATATDAQTAGEHLTTAWEYLLDSHEKAQEAAQLVEETTEENVKASQERTNEAIAALEAARSELVSAQEVFPSIDTDSINAYIDKRVEAFGYALASDEAFLTRNKEEATAQNDAYNTADAEAAELAKELPDDILTLVQTAYGVQTDAQAKTYSTARSQAAAADAFIRDYLGEKTK